MSLFFNTYRKKGVQLTLQLLSKYGENGIKQSSFLEEYEKNEEYLNSYFRVKGDLIQLGLIAFKLDEEIDKIIMITPKGLDLLSRIQEIENLLIEDKKEKPNNNAKSKKKA